MRRSWLRACCAALPFVIAGCAAPKAPPQGAPTDTLRIEGTVERPASWKSAELHGRTAIAQDVRFDSGHGPQSHTYLGTALWPLLNDTGLPAAAGKDGLLDRYLLAVGADGYSVVFSIGELHPEFGDQKNLVAYAESMQGQGAPLAAGTGPLRLTAPGDTKGGRYVAQLVRLELRASPPPGPGTPAAGAGGVAPSVTVSGQVRTSRSFDLDSLRALPAAQVQVGPNTYRGADLWQLLSNLGLRVPEGARNPTIAMYAVATGSDGYRVLVSLAEIDPAFGHRRALVAYERNGEPLERNGVARLVLEGDAKQGRSVSNLQSIEVFDATRR
jgi:DMSO/TMAO reductase YedYZ molybdopterin-dependent catalytic subunit